MPASPDCAGADHRGHVQDVEMTATIQEELVQARLMPEEQIVGYRLCRCRIACQQQQTAGIKLVGPSHA